MSDTDSMPGMCSSSGEEGQKQEKSSSEGELSELDEIVHNALAKAYVMGKGPGKGNRREAKVKNKGTGQKDKRQRKGIAVNWGANSGSTGSSGATGSSDATTSAPPELQWQNKGKGKDEGIAVAKGKEECKGNGKGYAVPTIGPNVVWRNGLLPITPEQWQQRVRAGQRALVELMRDDDTDNDDINGQVEKGKGKGKFSDIG